MAADRWASLYEEHVRRLRSLAGASTLDPSAADEIVQDADAGLIALGDDVEQPVAYLQRSVINLAINTVRRRRRFQGRDAVVEARHNGYSWVAIGAMVGTSGEAARQRYGRSVSAS